MLLKIDKNQPVFTIPDWHLLEMVMKEQAPDFMFMCAYHTSENTTLNLFKHRDTRRYINITRANRYEYIPESFCFWEFSTGGYAQISKEDAIHHVLS
ncbi:hypothetical protein LCGC14_1605350 [marine sediment metagenome]|uniref:Uncharacterized protein n=1 Tax=marine sediment metagenome TaxID=412755 RepID=A0A0F9KQM7_9ZZZZ